VTETPIQSREDQLVDLVLYAISKALRVREPLGDFGNTKIAKVVYDVAETMELPITRSWYMFGTYVWSDLVTEARMSEFWEPALSGLGIRHTVDLAGTSERKTFSQMETVVKEHALLFDLSLSDFLDRLYDRAPRQYQRVYKTHRKVLERFRNIASPFPDAMPTPQFLNGSRDITAFQKEMLVFDDMPDMVDLVIEFTSFMEDLMVKYDESLDDAGALGHLVSFFRDAYDYYRNHIWTFPPSVITRETVTGERQDAIREDRRSHLAKLGRYLDKPASLREEAFLAGFYPSRNEVLRSQEKLSQLLGNEERTLKEYFVRTLESASRE
jgi:hypothetical protein